MATSMTACLIGTHRAPACRSEVEAYSPEAASWTSLAPIPQVGYPHTPLRSVAKTTNRF